ncbi:MAG: hypothetical protein CL678_18720 [Bdellovibrionaceae bacterium]|nr:hypothetical protein [Pseudobdellovibrionaceae bacterium]|tara:strand:- start:551 stop:1288 length:738 start_codon:yes stop_codon:yes gene_type:complete
MKTFSLNLKKCLTVSIGIYVLTLPSWGSPLSQTLITQMKHQKKRDFRPLIQEWNRKYGTKAVTSLLEIAHQKKYSDSIRYMALMGATRMGGKAIVPQVIPLLNDSSWMLRSASLRTLGILQSQSALSEMIKILKKDKALVVRHDAVLALQKLKSKKTIDAFIFAIKDSKNYYKGKAQWIPQRAIAALEELPLRFSDLKKMKELLEIKDQEIVLQTIKVFEKVTGKKSSKQSFSQKIKFWEEQLQG